MSRISDHRCDAIAKTGKRCKRCAQWQIPCTAVYDARCNSYRADTFRDVHLCGQHGLIHFELERNGERLKLHHGGWLGAFNRYNFGSLVIDRPKVNWDTVKRFRVPKYWAQQQTKVNP